jgi:crossover junction endodeoxyribonuclease RuvC
LPRWYAPYNDSNDMKILGIDPGTVVMGYGVIESDGDAITLVDFGAIKAPEKAEIGERLSLLFNQLTKVIKKHRPDTVAVEAPFFSKNVHSAIAIGQAQAIAILAASNCRLPVHEYPPAKVKQAVAGYGTADKEQVQEMVRLQLGLQKAPHPTDASDALAVAICHVQETRLENIVTGKRGRR